MFHDWRMDVVRGPWITVVAVLTLVAAACTSTTETSTPPPPPATTLPAVTTTASPESSPRQITTTTTGEAEDPWEIRVVPVNDYAGADVNLGIEEIIDATAMVEATIEWIGEPGSGRWCCENPPLEVSDIRVVGGEFPQDSEGKINGIDYQSLDASLEIGDRVTMLMRGHTALLVFAADESLAHPAPQHQADAIDAMRVREARSAGGWDPLDYSPLRAVSDIWTRYRTDWWGSLDQRASLALSGVPAFPVVCSAADLNRLIAASPYQPSHEGLLFTVDRMRNEIVAAATSCDFDEILSLTAFVDGDDTDLFWWSGGSTPEVFVEADRRFGALRQLVLALTNTAYEPTEINAENSAGDNVDQTFYVWPSAAVLIGAANANTPTSQTLGEEEAARVAALNRLTVDELDESITQSAGYALFRTAIDAAGRWRFALSGD